jgi:hypothetical protein
MMNNKSFEQENADMPSNLTDNFIIDTSKFTVLCRKCHVLETILLSKTEKNWYNTQYSGDPYGKAKKQMLIDHILPIVVKHKGCKKNG